MTGRFPFPPPRPPGYSVEQREVPPGHSDTIEGGGTATPGGGALPIRPGGGGTSREVSYDFDIGAVQEQAIICSTHHVLRDAF